jgi:hypothetical protein
MAEKQRLHCEAHGGYFYRVPKRGRVPRNCGGSNPGCDAATVSPAEEDVPTVSEGHTQALKRAVKGPERSTAARNGSNPSLDKGQAAKALLEVQEWTVTGKAWTDEDNSRWASVTGARGEEMLHIVWRDGEVQDQVYNLWNLDTPSKNGRPNAHLPFDPDEIPDNELARILVGVKVRWWNKLGGMEETAIIGKDLQISLKWSGTGDAFPAARVISFVDAETKMYRAFRLDQLIKVG